jgi:hypothetical protein
MKENEIHSDVFMPYLVNGVLMVFSAGRGAAQRQTD